jgi:hypothetical protein
MLIRYSHLVSLLKKKTQKKEESRITQGTGSVTGLESIMVRQIARGERIR